MIQPMLLLFIQGNLVDNIFFYKWNQDLDPLVVSKNFMPFGGGIRQCAGAEYTKAFIATFLHVLVTKYR